MRLIVAGSRTFTDQVKLFAQLDRLHAAHGVTAVLSGCAAGADQLGERWATTRGVAVQRYPAAWRLHGRAAGAVRNRQMAAAAGAAAVFFGPGSCRGSADMVRAAIPAGLRLFVFPHQPNQELFK